ncbi:MAG TPA: tRNA epoxyqueuosine(34) reductase QueG [Bryobacteraceae bacterium]|nr:tRNA epoxyqueuosine(34) reductase QueG [Bryobacteraceae bacterium]
MNTATIKRVARECGFELAGVALAEPAEDFTRFEKWVERGMAGEMRYMTDRRAEIRRDPRHLLASARSIVCVGKLYNTAPGIQDPPISRYAWGKDYHDVLRDGLQRMIERLAAIEPFEWKICVDTAPLLERSYARQAGLGWIGKNTCLIHEPLGSWFFLGEIVTSLELEPDSPPPDRCGSCTRCIDACPTQALVPEGKHWTPEGTQWTLDARRCISYLTIELRGPIPQELQSSMGSHVFGCDICQEVCPWNSRAPVTGDPAFAPRNLPDLMELAQLSEETFHDFSRGTPLRRPKYSGFMRNVAAAMRNH